MKKIIVAVLIIFAIVLSGCIGNSNAKPYEEEQKTDAQIEYEMIQGEIAKDRIHGGDYGGSIVVLEKVIMSHNTIMYKMYDYDEDIIIYYCSSYKNGGVSAIPKNEIEYWKNYEPEV